MMRISQIEVWALQVIDRVRDSRPLEDARVEIKSSRIEPGKAARRLAAHANTAGGEGILWVIGLDEQSGTASAAPQELADWLPQVFKHFDGVCPSVTDVVVHANPGIVVALYIETIRAPFVVRNPVPSGPVTLEVPWREGTRTRSATRADLLRILTPVLSRPEIEVLKASVSIEVVEEAATQVIAWYAYLSLYIIPGETQLVIPCHRSSLSISNQRGLSLLAHDLSLFAPRTFHASGSVPASATIKTTPHEAIVDGPGLLEVRGEASSRAGETDALNEHLMLTIALTAVHSNAPSEAEVELTRVGTSGPKITWEYLSPSTRPEPLVERDGLGVLRVRASS
jgi:hypothetical protein